MTRVEDYLDFLVPEHPIIFSADMVCAILEGRKTQTRRIMRPQPFRDVRQYSLMNEPEKCWVWEPRKDTAWFAWGDRDFNPTISMDSPYGDSGHRIWVREKFALECPYEHTDGCGNPGHVIYWAGMEPSVQESITARWRPSIHMPRWASRITLDVLDVRVERVQDISGEDAVAEGYPLLTDLQKRSLEPIMLPCAWFRSLWDAFHLKRGLGWDVNPWVWVIRFPKYNEGGGR